MATESEDREWHDPKNWRSLGRYSAPNDPRVMVPKRNPRLGWTFNSGQPEGRRLIKTIFVTYGAIVAAIVAAFMAAKWLSTNPSNI